MSTKKKIFDTKLSKEDAIERFSFLNEDNIDEYYDLLKYIDYDNRWLFLDGDPEYWKQQITELLDHDKDRSNLSYEEEINNIFGEYLPREWAEDFIKNFASQYLRYILYSDINNFNFLGNPSKMMYSPKSINILSNSLDQSYARLLSNGETSIPFIRKGIFNQSEENINILERLYKLWLQCGRPKITNALTSSDIGGIYGRAFIDNNVIYNTFTLNDLISELSHPILDLYGLNTGVNKVELDWKLYSDDSSENGRFGNKHALEYETHNIIEPLLQNYVYNNCDLPWTEDVIHPLLNNDPNNFAYRRLNNEYILNVINYNRYINDRIDNSVDLDLALKELNYKLLENNTYEIK